MRRYLLAVTALTLIGCSGPKPVAFQSPAPANAMDCALGQATELNFYPIEGMGGSGAGGGGFVKLAREVDWSAGDIAREATTRVLTMGLGGAGRTAYEHLTITGAGGVLRVQIVGVGEEGKNRKPTDQGMIDARLIVERCGEG